MRNLSSQDDGGDDDGSSTSSICSSSDGEGSYFSEHLPSPPRRRESVGSHNPRLLPPGAGSVASRSGRNHLQMPTLQSQLPYSVSHESDLSLSSSSSEGDRSRIDDLERTYEVHRTNSAPVQGVAGKSKNNLDSNYLSDGMSVGQTFSKAPSNSDGEKLKIIETPVEDYLSMPLPKNTRRFPSTSSLVSSSSEDVGERNLGGGRSKHRRQSSYRSIGSLTSSGSALLPEKTKQWNESDGESDLERCKPPELVSFGGSSGSRHSKSSSSKRSSYDHRVPRNKSYNENHKVQAVTTLNDDQMNAWRSGMVRSDSYVSSSNGNASGQEISPDRKGNTESASVSNGSRYSKSSRNGSGIFVYSEDETDESTKYRELMAANAAQSTLNGTTSLPSSNNIDRPANSKRNRSFGRDLTNADAIEPSARNALINPTPERTSSRQNHPELVSSLSSQNPGELNLAEDMYKSGGGGDKMLAGQTNSYTLYWRRWLMLMYISLLNLLSDWTCFSIAPISTLTATTFQIVNPEHLVTVFLLANTIATATEPIILSRFGLRSTIVFGSFLLMIGNIVKSGGIPGILGPGLGDNDNVWRLYAGFFIVGLSQPLYQCTPSVLSSAWFPEKERTLATGVALNANQIGIGCSFIFGSLLVATGEDISKYFGLLSTLSTVVFFGCYIQFQDAPPSPPSETARVIRGNSTFPYMNTIKQQIPHYVRRFQGPMATAPMTVYERETSAHRRPRNSTSSAGSSESRSSLNKTEGETNTHISRSSRRSKRSERRSRGSPSSAFHKSISKNRSRRDSADGSHKSRDTHRRQRSHGSRSVKSASSIRSRRSENAIGLAPSPASGLEATEDLISEINKLEKEADSYGTIAPSPMMPGRVGPYGRREGDPSFYDTPQRGNDYGYQQHQWHQTQYGSASDIPTGPRHHTPHNNQYYGHNYNIIPEQIPVDHVPDTPFANLRYSQAPMSGNYSSHMSQMPYATPATPYDYGDTPVHYYAQMGDPRFCYQQQHIPPEYHHHHFHPSMHVPYHQHIQAAKYSQPNPRTNIRLPQSDNIDDGVEPVLTHAGSSLSIQIRDDQIFRSIRACFSRSGFIHTVVAFAVSGIVLNTISTYFGPLLRLNDEAGRVSVGVTGAFFQLLVMVSSLIVGRITDKSRSYYCVVIGLLLLGAFTLAECAINLEAERIENLKWTLLTLAVFVGPLQPVATELGVDV